MIEPNNPEINVDELMDKIRKDVVKRQGQVYSQEENLQSNLDTSKLKLSISNIEAFLKNAESHSIVRTKWPDKLNFFPFNLSAKLQKLIIKIINFLFKDQREVNFNIINSLQESVALNYQLIEQIATLKAQVDSRLVNMNSRVQGIDEQLVNMDSRVQGIDERLVNVDSCIQGINDSLSAIDTLISSWLTGIQEGLDTVKIQVQAIDEYKSIVDTRIERLNEHLITADTRIQEINEHYIRNDSYLKNDLMQQKRLITVFLEEAKKCLAEPFNQEQLQTFINEDIHFLDAFYVAFEEQFRGSREEIINRLKVYLPLIEEAKIGTYESPILDVGCGRGEWLELLQESGYTAKGLDINRIMVEQSRSRGFEVIEADVIVYMQSLPDRSLGIVTGFHIIEHLAFPTLMKFFSEVVRILKPGGLAIFETPNPQNVLVGSCNFYLDPTHRNPLPSSMIKFILETQGLQQVKVINLHPYPEAYKVIGSEIAERFNEYFYGPQDYAVVGYKL
ncbi:MAG: class I SAM-dependent methyltransferase [Nostoc sp. JL31]|uniref:class I SAM-dependent methyltransferase n=1 Tax=Nostoc sp. JL31 TaxID=2815395 RepID=UPI0025FC0E79|nr:class I SAM-dependent methyltransferase [Nostoc sp. JL31]MBN3891022.1 class I SAM-dependent methyltransferase [Nostoc sp. JL31]